MKIAVIGAGAIGNLVAGYLRQKQEDVVLIGHPGSVAAIAKSGLSISGVRGKFTVQIPIYERLQEEPELAILAVKTQDIDRALRDNRDFLSTALVLTAQNGVQADNLAAKYIQKQRLVSSIVMFGATYLEPAAVVHNFEGPWVIGSVFGANDEAVQRAAGALQAIFPTVTTGNITGMKYLKVFVNANNCIPAVLGMSMQEAFGDPAVSEIAVRIWKEGMGIVKEAGISLVSLPNFPLERLEQLIHMPAAEAAKIFSGIMANLSKEPLYGSILQSIKRNRESEVDYINGEFTALAKSRGLDAPLNSKLVAMVHQVEKSKAFFTKSQLLESAKE